MSSTARNRRAKDPDRVKFNRGRLVILAALLLLAGATTLTTRLLQNQTASALVIIALLVVAVPAVGRALKLVNRTVDDRYRGMRDENRAWAASIGGSFETTAAPPPSQISSIAFAEDRRVIVPVSASEVVHGDWRGRSFVAMHLSGYEKLRPGVEAKGRDASTNLVYLTLPYALPDLRITGGSVAHDYGRPMTEVVMPHDGIGGWWRVQSDDPIRSAALMNAGMQELLNGWLSPVCIAATGHYLISYGDPTGDAEAIVAQLEFLTAFADRVPRGAWIGDTAA